MIFITEDGSVNAVPQILYGQYLILRAFGTHYIHTHTCVLFDACFDSGFVWLVFWFVFCLTRVLTRVLFDSCFVWLVLCLIRVLFDSCFVWRMFWLVFCLTHVLTRVLFASCFDSCFVWVVFWLVFCLTLVSTLVLLFDSCFDVKSSEYRDTDPQNQKWVWDTDPRLFLGHFAKVAFFSEGR